MAVASGFGVAAAGARAGNGDRNEQGQGGMRGFLGGFILGAVTAVVIAAMALLVQPARQPDVASSSPPEVSTPSGEKESSVPRDAGRDADLVEAMPTAPDAAESAPGDAPPAVDEIDRRSAGRPSAAVRTGDLPEPGEGAGGPEGAGLTGAATGPEGAPAPGGVVPPKPPEAETAPDLSGISDLPSRPAVPGMVEMTGPPPAAPPEPDAAPGVPADSKAEKGAQGPDLSAPAQRIAEPGAERRPAPSIDTAASPEPAPAPAPTASATVAEDSGPVAPAAPDGGTAGLPSAPPAAPVAGAGEEPAAPDVEPARAPEESGPAEQAGQGGSRIAVLPQSGAGTPATGGPRVGERVVPLTERDDEAAQPAAEPEKPRLPPIEAFAEPYENPRNLPLMSIVLIDDAESFGAEALAEFPYPLTFAIDPTAPQAAEKMARHRVAGFEVVLLADLPKGAAPEEAAAQVESWLARVPEAVAVLEGTVTGVQGDRAVAERVTELVRRSGHGLVLQNRGLNTVQKLAAREGVPSAVVFRDFDGAGQTPVVMRRFLDQAAFRARQEGAVIMLGRVRPDTISALLLWGLQDRASRVALVPVSAVLTRNAK